MTAQPDPVHDEEFTARLLACDEALAAGSVPAAPDADASPELRTRLLRGLACVQRLQQLRPPLPMTSEAWPARIGRFEIRCPLGRGGFGIVYRAYDPVLGREVALKIPRADALVDADCRARFQHEARAAAGLDHPNLVPVHEAGELGPISYIALAYCPGSDLAAWLKQRTAPVRCAEAARLVLMLAQAIQYAHSRGILHRDLKPSNVLLSPVAPSAGHEQLWLPEPDTALLPRVTDFGLAKVAADDQLQTQTGDLLGTPCYMAPEQTDKGLGSVGPATDVYALGVILYEVLTGRPPFWAETTVETLLQVKTGEPVPPSRLRPQLPRDLETICLTCLHKEPWKRYASAEALAEDLRRYLAGRPILARPSSRGEQALKWARRRPALAAALGALVVVTLAGTAAVLQQWQAAQGALADQARARQAEATERERSEIALYHHGVVLAHHEWQAGNVGRAAQLLDECRTDLRDWEWRYVRRLCDSARFTCTGHSTHVMSVVFSPDGRYLASAAGLWFSTEPGEVKLWDAATGALCWTGAGHTGPVMSVAFRPDSRRLVSASTPFGARTSEIKIWDTAAGKAILTIPDLAAGSFGVAYSRDGSRLATAGADGKVRLWDADSGRPLFVLEEHTANVFSVAFSPDGRQLASAGWDGTARVWDLASRRVVQRLRGPRDLRSVAYSPDGQHLVTASFDQSVKVWDVATGQLVYPYWAQRAPVLCALFAPDGRRIASSDSAGTVHIWDMETGRRFRIVRGHTGPVNGVAFSPNGRQLATAGRDRTVRLWDITREQDVDSLPQAAGAYRLALSPTKRILAASGYKHTTGTMEKRVRLWSLDDPAGPRYWPGHDSWVRCVAFNGDETLLASGGADRTVRLWDLATGQARLLAGHLDEVTAVTFPRHGTRLASASLDRTVRLWDLAAAEPCIRVLAHPQPVHDAVLAPDGKRLVAVGGDGMAIVWDAATGTQRCALPGHRDAVERVVVSPDGRWLATAGADKTIRVWDMTAALVTPVHILAGHTDRVAGLCFSSDGRRLASAGGDQTIRIWDVASGNVALTLRGHPDHVCDVAFSPDGRLLLSAGTRDIKVWDAGTARAEAAGANWHWQEIHACRAAEPPHWFGTVFHLSRLLDAKPEDWRLLGYRAQAELELGAWRAAAEDAARSIALGATDPAVWSYQAVAQLQLGDMGAYRRTCTQMMKRFGTERRAGIAHCVAWTCALGPDAVADVGQVVRLAELALAAEPSNECYRSLLGEVLYRAGHFQLGRASLHLGLQHHCPEAWLFQAMVHHRLGQTTEARAWLDKAARWHETTRRDPRVPGTPGPIRGNRLAQVDVLLREATELIAAGR